MYTYQKFLAEYAGDAAATVDAVVTAHKASEEYKLALDADEYDRQKNVGIMTFQKTMKTVLGREIPDPFAANNKIPSNFFRRLNTQRNEYLLGNGAYFEDEAVKEKLGQDFDTQLQKIGYAALIHRVAFGYWTGERLHCFRITEFAPLYDEMTGALMAGVRFWQVGDVDDGNPLHMWLYAIDGITKFTKDSENKIKRTNPTDKPEPYVSIVKRTEADGEEFVDGKNYPSLPIVPLWGSELRQSTLVGMRCSIDSYDMICSGFANDMQESAYIYWIISGAEGMLDEEKKKLLQEIQTKHIAAVSGGDARTHEGDESKPQITPYTQDVPYQARTTYLESLRRQIYENFGAVDVSAISAAAKTATEIQAAYQPLDENADDYEYQVIEFVQGVLSLLGLDGTPVFKRNKVSNDLEHMQVLAMASAYLDRETIVRKMPSSIVGVDEIEDVLKRIKDEDVDRFRAEEETPAGETETVVGEEPQPETIAE